MTTEAARLRRAVRRWRLVSLALALALVVVLALRLRDVAAPETPEDDTAGTATGAPRLVLTPVGFDELSGWAGDDLAAALPALLASCGAWERRPAGWALSSSGVGGTAGDWRPFCQRARRLAGAGGEALRAFLATELTPYRVADGERLGGLITGYYEPVLRGSRERAPGYEHPVYRRPPELVEADLGSFRPDLTGRRIAGTVAGGRLRPFADRSAIDAGALAGRGLELVWVDDPVGLFFLHVQGSGRVELVGGGTMRLGFAGQNGHPYHAIGRTLVERGALAAEEVSMQSIRAWLESHPAEAAEVMARNASFVFFRQIESGGARGSLGVELTAGRSAAVDRGYLPLGAPLWVDTTLPAAGGSAAGDRPWRRLMLAQDTGGAIRGPLRADLFWGAGAEAAAIAGRMRQEGRLWLLLPRSLETATAASSAAGE